ncbi:ran-binding protein 9-like [Pollicipes pollicipes]|uniref:ran-binding protein 9-like n=1 Tax=Pollicipes pollicipes TaxID=41117 RepID=UPI001884DC34|nr:ran-binding protein 9-like [Pollicipes pollicipes]XP_037085724.1 ran-binding protein 9-like [Pollicipes pollicipes]
MELCAIGQDQFADRLKQLYPMVDTKETPLPTCWSQKDKFQDVGLTQNNLRAHYKGNGKTNKDAASVRASHPIPPACGLYYFEVKIVSKGRDGYMGIGLSQQGTSLNRLPGWEKYSYGYHGDDGYAFNSTTTGQPYGPTFTTGDVIGCGINLVDNTCFYTKNGHHLGIAFTDLRPDLYPTVGLQTPGEMIDANFGQSPFVYDIEDMMRELRTRVRATIQSLPVPDALSCWQDTLHRMVQTYLVHHGYCSTAEAFANSTGISFDEDLASIKSRQKIQRLVLAGRMGEAIELTQRLYPGLLEKQQSLLFLLRVRQFIEMVNGSDSEVSEQRAIQTSVIQSTRTLSEAELNANNAGGDDSSHSNGFSNGHTAPDADEEMDVDRPAEVESTAKKRALCGGSNTAVEKVLKFGRELQLFYLRLRSEQGESDYNKNLLQDAFSLLAYADPWSSPVKWQLDPVQRESVCAALNSAILSSHNLPRRPPLEVALSHSKELVALMARAGLGACAFANIDALFQP